MELKCALHNHAGEDPEDKLSYSTLELIDRAKELSFDAVAVTLHNRFFHSKKIREYAEKNKILLIPGIEIDIKNRHVLILGANSACEKIRSFADLKKWKEKNPNSFVLAPHPYFPFFPPQSLGKYLKKNLACFDGVELSFFYTKWIDFNRRGRKIARENNLPLVATADCHNLDYLDIGYCTVKTKKRSVNAILNALHKNDFRNYSKPSSWLKLLKIYGKMIKG